MAETPQRIHVPFRLNLEQQKTRAKELCRAVRAGDPATMARIAACRPKIGGSSDLVGFRLSDAQAVIARELGLLSWPKLKAHITAMERARTAIGDRRAAPDGDVKTLHLRCGSDIAGTLTEAGFSGDFQEYSNPFCQGPVTGDPDQSEQIEARAHFLTQAYGDALGFSFSQCADKLRLQEAALASAAEGYMSGSSSGSNMTVTINWYSSAASRILPAGCRASWTWSRRTVFRAPPASSGSVNCRLRHFGFCGAAEHPSRQSSWLLATAPGRR